MIVYALDIIKETGCTDKELKRAARDLRVKAVDHFGNGTRSFAKQDAERIIRELKKKRSSW